jgi:hypothetical protein
MSVRIHKEIDFNVFEVYFCHKISPQFAGGKLMRKQGKGDNRDELEQFEEEEKWKNENERRLIFYAVFK